METHKQSARAGKSTDTSELGDKQDSVMAKYIDRFRHGRPQSREERQQMHSVIGEKQLPFWWMPSSSLPRSSTDTDGSAINSPAVQRRHDTSLSPCRGSLSILSDTYWGELDDTEILHLQEKASRLLLKGECTLSDGSIPVSSEGLECSNFSSPVSVDEPARRSLIPSLIRSTDPVPAVSSCVIPSLVPPTRREDDILFQWRLRRKMEQAREGPQSLQQSSQHGPTFTWQGPVSNHPSASGQTWFESKQHQSEQPPEISQKDSHSHITAPLPETKEVPGPCPPVSGPPPGSSVLYPQTVAHVPAHLHLLCEVLPFPIQSSCATTQQNISGSKDESQTKVVRKKTQVPGDSVNNFMNKTISESGAIERAGLSQHKSSERGNALTRASEKNERKTAPSFRKQKKSTRYTSDREHADGPGSTSRSPSHQRVSAPKVMQQQQEGSRGFPCESSTGDHAPPPSPIHSALGQVVSEVLFSPVDLSPAPDSSVSPTCTSSAPPHSSVPPCDAQNSMEVISQLLQEAEDSDEKEFEDDPLLQVLRKQRRWVKEQISEVDSVLQSDKLLER
ncbi:proline and serine-rich protein 3 isoform X2 [Etheostoma cragini]|nr:proline and serine-rich protein 3 isoform X2 [Etheostoma cragini]XP_034731289.1 proline and serine-rich protein 3 isoform X2 [Etheostoma cragini]